LTRSAGTVKPFFVLARFFIGNDQWPLGQVKTWEQDVGRDSMRLAAGAQRDDRLAAEHDLIIPRFSVGPWR
jgi:hypothetical protein